MKITKTIDLGSKEVEVEVSAEDIRLAMEESLMRAWKTWAIGEDRTTFDFKAALNAIYQFLVNVPDEQLDLLSPTARKLVASAFRKLADRFAPQDEKR